MSASKDNDLREREAYFIWNTTYLLRSLGVMDNLTPVQQKLVESDCQLRAATFMKDIAADRTKLKERIEASKIGVVNGTWVDVETQKAGDLFEYEEVIPMAAIERVLGEQDETPLANV